MFTKSQIKEVAELLKTASIKDSKFTVASALDGTEYVAVLQDAKSKRTLLRKVFFYLERHIDPAIVVAIQCVLDILSTDIKKATEEIEGLIRDEHAITRETVLDTKDELTDSMKSVEATAKSVEQSVTLTIGATANTLIEKMDSLDSEIVSGISESVSDTISNVIESKMDEYLDKLDTVTSVESITTEEIDDIMSDDESSEEE